MSSGRARRSKAEAGDLGVEYRFSGGDSMKNTQAIGVH
jgi:hypothetical protein